MTHGGTSAAKADDVVVYRDNTHRRYTIPSDEVNEHRDIIKSEEITLNRIYHTNDPSAGSPTDTLLRLLHSLNEPV